MFFFETKQRRIKRKAMWEIKRSVGGQLCQDYSYQKF